VVLNAAGSAPGDLHKLWRSRDPRSYNMEYAIRRRGFEIPGVSGQSWLTLRASIVVIGDGSYLMCLKKSSRRFASIT